MNLVPHKPEKDKDGSFMRLITPRYEFAEKDILPRDVCFVLDVSGSMRNDDRLLQAKEALKYCVNSLTDKDRFNVITFSNSTNPMGEALVAANKENKESAAAFIDKQEPLGGTAIEAALKLSLGMRPETEKDRPYIVVFLTDGRPTIGTDDLNELVGIAAPKDANTRIFTWGVGSDVNTHLLDRIAQQTRAVSEYVIPDEKMETKVSLFFNKLSKPVMANPKIDWGKMTVRDVHPAQLPDLFTGQQLTVFGRYEGEGDTAIALAGNVTDREEKQTFEDTLTGGPANAFVEKLWASRHVGFLLDEIRLHGEKTELKDEVIRLSRTYGIQTPYTSYLILDSEQAYKDHGIARGTKAGTRWSGRPTGPSDFQKETPPGVRVTGTKTVRDEPNVDGVVERLKRSPLAKRRARRYGEGSRRRLTGN
jgi:Ca-activated chloride channel family protein